MEWSWLAVDDERPSVSFPNECLLGKYTHTVLYFVAGWTLSSASKKGAMYATFAKAHFLEMEEAKLRKLPRKHRAKIYCTDEYYKFVCFVESIYLEDLNVKMMQAHTDGDIVDIIKKALLSSDIVVAKFSPLCNNESCESFSKEDVYKLMSYMMQRYANMQGTYFAKHLKTNVLWYLVEKMANSQSTRA